MSLCPWTSCTEWNDVLELLYSSETEHRRKGLARVAAWKARGVIPALVEVTVDIVSCLVHEEDCGRCMDFSEQALRLMYAMALTRFVNGAFDVHYVTSPGLTKDIKTVLGHFGVPAYIVTLRHKCAHRALPSMEALKCGAGIALQWLMDNYWEPQRQHNQQREQNSVPKAPEATVSFSTVAKFRRPVKRTKSFLSDCSAM
jgi:hypothetical protein